MFQIAPKGGFGRNVLVASVALCAGVAASAAFAGGCPTDQVRPNATKPVDVGHDGVTDTVIAMIDVDKEQGINDRKFRMRKLVIQPGGEGQIEEYASNCAVPIVH